MEELWVNPIFMDEEKNRSELERRQKAIEKIRTVEILREEKKRGELEDQYNKLSKEDRDKFSEAQKFSAEASHEFINGKKDFSAVTSEEEFVLAKIKRAYEDFKKDSPNEKFSFDFSNEIDKQVWDNLNYRKAFDILNIQKGISNQEEANKIREEIGMPIKDIDKNALL